MRREKLLCFSTSLGGGGAERQMLALIQGLNTRNIIPEVLNCRGTEADYPTSEVQMNRHIVRVKFRFFEKICLLWRIFRIHPKVLLSYDGGPNLVAAVYKFLFRNCRVVVSERNTQQLPLQRRDKFLYKLYKYVDLIISNSHAQAEFLKCHYPGYAYKVRVITNYTDTNSYQPRKKALSNPIKIIVPARYTPQKNTLRFLDVIHLLNNDSECPPFECEWWGMNERDGVKTEYYLQCKRKRKSLSLHNVRLCGYQNKILEILYSADVICLPSLYEGFSNTLSEAVCIGKPVLVSCVCDNPTFVREGRNGYLFDPNNTEEMAATIKKMLLQSKRYKEFGLNSRQLSLELFDREKFVDSYIKELDI